MGYLDGKAVVVTGAGRGMGAAYARHAAAEGAAVIVNDIDSGEAEAVADGIASHGGTAVADGSDVASWTSARGLIERCATEFGHIDGLVNNAALMWVGRPDQLTEADLRKTIDVNVLGTAFCGLHALRLMTARGRGSIVNVTSGAHAGIPLQCAYSASKGAVASLTYAWAADVAATGVRVNAISPMGTTRMTSAMRDYTIEEGGEPWPEVQIPPDNNAPIVTFLLSDAADGITGQVVRVEGEHLSLMTHPSVLYPAVRHTGWTVDEVERAFDEDLRHRLLPLGVAALDATVRDRGASYLPADTEARLSGTGEPGRAP
jgi:NAD(P)-dependent dehydrogenase (short-subunit alcohol dehydrogenase family)